MATKKKAASKSTDLFGAKTYKKTHTLKKVANIHARKIRDRGGKATIKPEGKKFKIEYKF